MIAFFSYWILKLTLRNIGYRLTRTGETTSPFKVQNYYHPSDAQVYATLEEIERDFGL